RSRTRAIPAASRQSVASQCLAATGRVGAAQLRFPAATAGFSVDRSGSGAPYPGSGLLLYILVGFKGYF
ncbi:hypothetical protein A2U01_0068421, partial [Trifolium medium]|nr:hypothetical protein [Trifolium medium]